MPKDKIIDGRPKEVPPAKIPDYVTFHPKLKGLRGCAAVRLYAVLDRHVNGKTRVAHPGWRVLCKGMKCNANTISKALKALEEIKAIGIERGKKSPKGRPANIYRLLPVQNPIPGSWKGHKTKPGDQGDLFLGGEQPCSWGGSRTLKVF